MIARVHYAYPSSIIGKKRGCFYVTVKDQPHLMLKFDCEHAAVHWAVELVNHHGAKDRAVEMTFGEASRADQYRRIGVTQAMDNVRGS